MMLPATGRIGPLSRRAEKHADGRSGAKETRLPLSHKLRKDTAGARHSGRQYICQGKFGTSPRIQSISPSSA